MPSRCSNTLIHLLCSSVMLHQHDAFLSLDQHACGSFTLTLPCVSSLTKESNLSCVSSSSLFPLNPVSLCFFFFDHGPRQLSCCHHQWPQGCRHQGQNFHQKDPPEAQCRSTSPQSDPLQARLLQAREDCSEGQIVALTCDQCLVSMVNHIDNYFCRKRNAMTLLNVFADQATLLNFAKDVVTSLCSAFLGHLSQVETSNAIPEWVDIKLGDLLPLNAHNQVKATRRSSGCLP